jgi:phosphotransferase system HPr-like phosphotransfer protein
MRTFEVELANRSGLHACPAAAFVEALRAPAEAGFGEET